MMSFRCRDIVFGLVVVLSLMVQIPAMSPAFAQDKAAVQSRAAMHENYSRLVFDWPGDVPYQLEKQEDGKLSLKFEQAGAIPVGGLAMSDDDNIRAVTLVNGDSDAPEVLIDIPGESRFRHFNIGGRVIIDIYNPAGTAPRALKDGEVKTVNGEIVAAQAPVETPEPSEPEAEPQEGEPANSEDVSAVVTAEEVEEAETTDTLAEVDMSAVISASALDEVREELRPHVLAVSSTEAIGIAVFERYGYLWTVIDRADIPFAPILNGPQVDRFGTMEEFEVQGGLAYRMKLPDDIDLHVYGEGGGLVWRVVISPTSKPENYIPLQRSFTNKRSIRSGIAYWEVDDVTKILELADPMVGDIIRIGTVGRSDLFAGPAQVYPEYNILRSPVGFAVQSKADDLGLAVSERGLEITKPGGLVLTREDELTRHAGAGEMMLLSNVPDPQDSRFTGSQNERRMYHFNRWMMGGEQAIEQNERILMQDMGNKSKSQRTEDVLTLAKMYIANGRGPEALGFLDLASKEVPALTSNAEFLALRGAAYALSHKFELAFRDFSQDVLKDYKELDYWRAFTLAWLEDWRQSMQMLPDDFDIIMTYPIALLERVGVKLAEVALRHGNVNKAEELLAALNQSRPKLMMSTQAGMDYLLGEANRQIGDIKNARKIWNKLLTSMDDFFRARAGLALTMLELQENDDPETMKSAINRLEGLRFAWRGDELEARVNSLLGQLYLEADQYLKGLSIMRDAASMSPGSDIARDITKQMKDSYYSLLTEDPYISSLDAVTVYEEFRELTPGGMQGNRLVQHLAERLVEADLLSRASDVLQHQVDYRLEAEEKARVAMRLAAIYMLDRNPRPALSALNIAEDYYMGVLTGDERKQKREEISLLRARAFSQLDKTEEAIELLDVLPPSREVNHLRADIAWQAGLWQDAAFALKDLILDEDIDVDRPLTPGQANLILNRAVALNLGGDRVELNNMRERYGDLMKDSDRGDLFEIVSRPRKTAILTNRQAVEDLISEVDLFQDFLEAYKDNVAVKLEP
jgi:tetratricopeptide (TPR) repeat protein